MSGPPGNLFEANRNLDLRDPMRSYSNLSVRCNPVYHRSFVKMGTGENIDLFCQVFYPKVSARLTASAQRPPVGSNTEGHSLSVLLLCPPSTLRGSVLERN